MNSSQNKFYSQSVRVLELFFRIRISIDNPEYDIQRSNFEFWDELYKNSIFKVQMCIWTAK